jgi:hypothetical protein
VQTRDTSGGDGHYQDALNNPDNICWFLKKNGFVQRDGSEITGLQNFRWKYDINNKVYFNLNVWSNWTRGWNLHWEYNYNNDNFDVVMENAVLWSEDEQVEFFIPLKNQGFIITNHRQGFRIYGRTPTPPLYTLGSLPYNSYGGDTFTTTICFFNNITNKYNYLTGTKYGEWGQWNYHNLNLYLSDQTLQKYRVPFVDDGNGSYNAGLYTDVKQNICTMIKYPYNNNFVSNLYLITTVPVLGKKASGSGTVNCDSTGLENKFFSFNGRNFYGVYANLAVELPAN